MRDSYEDSPATTRESGLRRLRRLTWRTSQLGAVATVGFAIVFARTAPTPAANVKSVLPTEPSTTIAVPSQTPGQHSATPRSTASTRPATGPATQPAVQPGVQQTAQGTAPKPTTAPAPAPSSSRPLAPPTTAPAPAPTTSSASPVPTVTSTSHGGA